MKTLPALSLLAGAALALVACLTPAQVKAIFTDEQVACEAEELASSVIPAGTPAATVASDVAAGCNIAAALLPDVEAVVVAYMGATTRAPAGAVYSPGARVRAARVKVAQ